MIATRIVHVEEIHHLTPTLRINFIAGTQGYDDQQEQVRVQMSAHELRKRGYVPKGVDSHGKPR